MKEAPQMVNSGIGPISYQFLCSVFKDGSDGAMSRVKLFRNRQRLDALLIATPEQLKGMKIEIADLEQILNFSKAHLAKSWNKLEPQLTELEKLAPSPRIGLSKTDRDLLSHGIIQIRELIRTVEDSFAEFFQMLQELNNSLHTDDTPRAAMEEHITELVQCLQEYHRDLIKSLSDRIEQCCADLDRILSV